MSDSPNEAAARLGATTTNIVRCVATTTAADSTNEPNSDPNASSRDGVASSRPATRSDRGNGRARARKARERRQRPIGPNAHPEKDLRHASGARTKPNRSQRPGSRGRGSKSGDNFTCQGGRPILRPSHVLGVGVEIGPDDRSRPAEAPYDETSTVTGCRVRGSGLATEGRQRYDHPCGLLL